MFCIVKHPINLFLLVPVFYKMADKLFYRQKQIKMILNCSRIFSK